MPKNFRFAFAVVMFTVASACFIGTVQAKTHSVSVITMSPATDGGKYITLNQSNTLPQWSYNLGSTFDFVYKPLEYADSTGTRRGGIVDDLFVANFQAAIGFTDWWSMGANLPLAMWEVFYDPSVPLAAVTKENVTAKLGDLRAEMKFRFLDIERYHVGVSLVPFMYFPTGKSTKLLGNGMWSPGATIVLDGDIKNRVFLTFNIGYRNYANTRYGFDANSPNAVIDDTLNLGGGINVRITDSWAVLGEIWSQSVLKAFFKNQLQNPSEFLAGGRFTPQSHAKGLAVTVAGGRGITRGVGSPDFRVLAGINYRHIHMPPPPPPLEVKAQIEEKITITQKIHFEFNKAIIKPGSFPILDAVVNILQINPDIKLVRIEGHTDWIGPNSINQKLSERRAKSVRHYLVSKGIEPSRLEAVGYGESRPIADNNTTKGRAKNRRTEFTVISE